MKVVAVIPAHNEEGSIAQVVEDAKQYVDSVVVVDDGSRDSTFVNAGAADVVLRHSINMHKGFSLVTGIEAALREGAEVIVTLDADNQHDPADIPRFLDALRNEDLDIVFGSRQLNADMPFILRAGNWWLTTSTRLLFGIHIGDTQSGFRVFTRDAYKKLKWGSHDYRAEAEMIANAARHGLAHKELSIETVYHGNYKGTTVVDGLRIFLSMLWWRITK